jgi:hypothetical protein
MVFCCECGRAAHFKVKKGEKFIFHCTSCMADW